MSRSCGLKTQFSFADYCGLAAAGCSLAAASICASCLRMTSASLAFRDGVDELNGYCGNFADE